MRLSLNIQLFQGSLFDAFKKKKSQHKARAENDSDEDPEPDSTYVKNLLFFLLSNYKA